MLESLLIANRGEIACRIIRSAKRLGIRTVAVYSDADAHALHVEAADRAVCIGPARAIESYLDIAKVIDAALAEKVQAVHPGYGFLSENAAFAQRCVAAGLIFVGPPASAIASMGSKTEAKRLMQAAGVPILPGYHGDDQSLETLVQEADKIGYPLLIKASAGGGGKGMRVVDSATNFVTQLEGAKRESKAAFADDAVLLERYLIAPKHIEVQIMADGHGDAVHLFERDCSVQRRHQKVIEEAPGPIVTPAMRAELGAAAVKAAKQVGYVGAGTVEFIVENGQFYFMEMNTRLQVEHPVTEAITGLDLVELQLAVASGAPLPMRQEDLAISGHAVEVRLYAENPGKRFLPSTGRLERFDLGAGIRIDTGVRQGDRISMHYDPMLAKLIAWAPSRRQAIDQLVDALQHSQVAGVDHNLGYLARLLNTPEFRAGDYTTGIADVVYERVVPNRVSEFAALCARARFLGEGATGWDEHDGFRLNLPSARTIGLRQGKKDFRVDVRGDGEVYVNDEMIARLDGQVLAVGTTIYAMAQGHTEKFTDKTDDASGYTGQSLSLGGIVAPMPGQIIAVNVAVGDTVKVGDVLVVLEAMKMEHGVTARTAGSVKRVLCAAGDRVVEGAELVEVE